MCMCAVCALRYMSIRAALVECIQWRVFCRRNVTEKCVYFEINFVKWVSAHANHQMKGKVKYTWANRKTEQSRREKKAHTEGKAHSDRERERKQREILWKSWESYRLYYSRIFRLLLLFEASLISNFTLFS